MDKRDIIILAQIGILATLIYSIQIIFEFIESMLRISGNWSYAVLIFNPILAVIIITIIYSLWTQNSMPKIIRTYSILLYVAIQFVLGNINNGFDIQRIEGTFFTPLFYLAIGLSIVIFTVMYFILTSTIDLVSKMMKKKNKINEEIGLKRISVKAPQKQKEDIKRNIPKIQIYKDELPKLAVIKKVTTKEDTKKKIKKNKKKTAKKEILKKESTKKNKQIKSKKR